MVLAPSVQSLRAAEPEELLSRVTSVAKEMHAPPEALSRFAERGAEVEEHC